jgi:hypothetical protein
MRAVLCICCHQKFETDSSAPFPDHAECPGSRYAALKRGDRLQSYSTRTIRHYEKRTDCRGQSMTWIPDPPIKLPS